jgi:signal transduction histidine kinase
MRPRWNSAIPYAVAVGAVALALLLKFLFTGLGADHPFVLLPAAVIVAAWYGGRRPGFTAAVLAAAGTDVLFLAPSGFGVSADDVIGVLGLQVEAFLIDEITVRMRTAQRRAREEAAAANVARRELSLALRLREELLAFWSEKLHGPLTHLVFGLRAARVAVEAGDRPQALMALDGVVGEIQAVQRTAEQWLDRARTETQSN